ncbi:Potassium voltage-gated channel subfamily KQT member 1 [Nymphon striatum]|nr:Potassium voltage-gated channel subfamily KQT member 1 [Nymphon striatum]
MYCLILYRFGCCSFFTNYTIHWIKWSSICSFCRQRNSIPSNSSHASCRSSRRTWRLLGSVVFVHRQELITTLYIGFLDLYFLHILSTWLKKMQNPKKCMNMGASGIKILQAMLMLSGGEW